MRQRLVKIRRRRNVDINQKICKVIFSSFNPNRTAKKSTSKVRIIYGRVVLIALSTEVRCGGAAEKQAKMHWVASKS